MTAITIGEGVNRPQGHGVELKPPYPEAVYAALSAQPGNRERWQSIHTWKNDYRTTEHWLSSIGVCLDIDHRGGSTPTPVERERLLAAAKAKQLPGSIFHLTPRGARLMFIYELPCARADMQIAAAKGAGVITERAFAELELSAFYVDSCSFELGRLYYTHNCEAKGVKRDDELVFMRTEPFDIDPLAAEAPVEPEPAPRIEHPRGVIRFEETIPDAIRRWVADHPVRYPKRVGTCPVCNHNGCFKVSPDNGERWYCFSTDHGDVGVKGEKGHHGDAMDIETATTGLDRVAVLRRDGYLSAPRAPRASADEPTPIRPEQPAPIATRSWRQRSYLTCLDILRKNARDVLEGRPLELNELTGQIELGRKLAADVDISKIRALIEARFVGSVDKEGHEKGMQQSSTDVFAAMEQVAKENAYNPVQQYLAGLVWDAVPRIEAIAEDILGAERSEINQAIVRRFMVSAVARAMQPGCKCDTVLVLVGKQGAGKSSFFRILAGDAFFGDTAVDLHSKDSLQVLRGTWLYEWAELEALNRSRDAEAAKAFLSSPVDRYRPSYGRLVVEVPRTCVIVGSTNKQQFLEDETGNRRFLPIVSGRIDTVLLREQRDQLWAEAVAAYRAGERWWLTDEEDALLKAAQEGHQASDAWSDAVLALDYDGMQLTTADVIRLALKKDIGQWSRGDEMRIGKILRQAGYEKLKPSRGGRFWRKP